MNIKTEELKKFLQFSSPVRTNVALFPDLEAVKIQTRDNRVVFTKSNHYIFCEYSYEEFTFEEQTFLISERLLQGIAETCQRETFTAKEEGECILLDYSGRKTKAQRIPSEKFPKTPAAEQNGSATFEMNKQIVESIAVASRHMSRLPQTTMYSYVHVNEHGVFATDGGFTYYNSVGKGLPEIFFDDKVLGAISAIEGMKYAAAGNYDVFSNGTLLYAFIKNEYKTFDYLKFILVPTEHFFEIRRNELIEFCTMVEYTTREEIPIASFQAIDDKLLAMSYNDAAFSLANDFKIPYIGNFQPPEFKFNAKGLLPILRALPYERLVFSHMPPHYKIITKEDVGYIGIISALK